MSNIAIQVENLSKRYRIGVQETRHETMGSAMLSWLKSPFTNFRRLRELGSFDEEEADDVLWALRDLSFTVNQGEVIGVIGHNGAGKSTLLKILSRITPPTLGRITLNGRVASLLEVGTGFHPELTGRENVYLNGTILGMRKTEIDQKFDEIVDFSGVEKFIDTPVKRYSSGMRVRLAFSVAAHLDPEILLVDEVLAVGDAAFQKKSLGKMSSIAQGGRTILFVSHNMAAIKQMCSRAIYLQAGSIQVDDDSHAAVEQYLNGQRNLGGSTSLLLEENRSGIGGARITNVQINNNAHMPSTSFGIGEPFRITLELQNERLIRSMVVGFEIKALDGYPILNLRSDSQNIQFGPFEAGETHQVMVEIPGLPFYPGTYLIEPWIAESKGKRLDHIHNCINISLESAGYFEAERLVQQGRGLLIMDCVWKNDD